MSGYDAKQYIDASVSQFWGESFGQIYPALERLRAEKLVRCRIDKRSPRERKVFEITAEGRNVLASWLAIAPELESPRSEAILKTFLGEHAPPGVIVAHLRALVEQMDRQVAVLEETEKQVRLADAGSSALPYAVASIRAGIHILRARSAWARETIDSLEASSRKG